MSCAALASPSFMAVFMSLPFNASLKAAITSLRIEGKAPVLVNYGTYDTAMPIEQGAQRIIATAPVYRQHGGSGTGG